MRTVKVGLEADVAAYLSAVTESGKVTESLDRKIKEVDRDLGELERDSAKAAAGLAVLDAAAKKAKDDVGGLGKETESLDGKSKKATDSQDKLSRKAKETADTFKLLGVSVSDVGTHLDGIGKDRSALDVIDAKLKSLAGEAKTLGDEFVRTGSTSVFDKIGKNGADQNALKKLRKTVSDTLGEAAQEAGMLEKFGTSVQGMLPEALSNPVALAGVIAAGAVIGTTLIAAIGGAVTAGAGLTIAGLGVAGAVMGNPEAFATEWSGALRRVKKDWIDASAPFVGPTLDAIRSIGPLVDSWHLDTTFAKAATFVKPLTAGVEGFATFVEAGVDALVQHAGPVIEMLAAALPELGADIQSAFEAIAENSQGGAAALGDVIGMLGTAIGITGFWIGQLEQTYGVFDTMSQHATKFFNDYRVGLGIVTFGGSEVTRAMLNAWNADNVDHFGAALDGAQGKIDETGRVVSDTADDMAKLNKEFDKTAITVDTFIGKQVVGALNTMMGLDRATLDFNGSLLQLSDTLKQNGLAIDRHTGQVAMNTEKGIANRQAVLSSVSANVQIYKSNIDAGMSAEQAAAAYDTNTQALEANLRKAHFTQAEIDGLIGKYRGVPRNVDTDVVLHGLETAIRDLNTTLRLINGIHDKNVTVSVTTVYKIKGGPNVGEGGTRLIAPGSAELYGGIRKAATGLLVPPSDPGSVLFGEPATGGEAYIPLKGISPGRAMDLAQTVGNGYGFDAVPRGWMGRAPAQAVAVAVSVEAGANASLTPLGSLFNQMLRNGDIVVKASQVRTGI